MYYSKTPVRNEMQYKTGSNTHARRLDSHDIPLEDGIMSDRLRTDGCSRRGGKVGPEEGVHGGLLEEIWGFVDRTKRYMMRPFIWQSDSKSTCSVDGHNVTDRARVVDQSGIGQLTRCHTVWHPLVGHGRPSSGDLRRRQRERAHHICCNCSLSPTMSALRLLSQASRRAAAPAPRVLGRRGYAEVADKIKLSLVLPHQVRLTRSTRDFDFVVLTFLTCFALGILHFGWMDGDAMLGHLYVCRCRPGQHLRCLW